MSDDVRLWLGVLRLCGLVPVRPGFRMFYPRLALELARDGIRKWLR